jgi:hypothetical protein
MQLFFNYLTNILSSLLNYFPINALCIFFSLFFLFNLLQYGTFYEWSVEILRT